MKQEENKQLETVTEEIAVPASKKTPFWKNRKLRMGTTATVFTAVFVAAVVLLNVIVGILNDRYPLHIDLTEENLYTLSEDSETVAAGIKKPVEIVVFGDEDNYKNSNSVIYKQIYEFTRQYHTLTNGLVAVKYVDATKDPKTYAQYSSYVGESATGSILFLGKNGSDVQPQSVVAAESDFYEFDQEAYYYYGQFSLTASLVEKTLAANLQAVTREAATGVVLLTGHEEYSYAMTGVQQVLKQNGYSNVTQQDITTAAEFPKEASVAVICAPAEDYTADELTRLAEWLNNDDRRERNLVVFTHPSAACPNLYEYLAEEHGIQVENHLMAENSLENMFQYDPYAAYANVADSDYAGELYTESARVEVYQSRELTPLWTTDSEKSFTFNTVLATVSTETGVSVSLDEKAETGKLAGEGATLLLSTDTIYDSDTSEALDTYVLAVGSAAFLSLDYENNETLFMNAFNGMCDNAALVSVGSTSLTAESLTFDAGTANVLGLGVFTIGLPLVMIALGVFVFIRRRHL